MLDTPSRSSIPQATDSVSPASLYQRPESPKKPSLRSRFLIGAALVSLGLTIAGIGIASIVYRLTHLTVHDGLVNARQVRLQSPIDGEVKDFFARPGVTVPAGQVLVRLIPGPDQQQAVLQQQGEVASKTAQLLAARQSLMLLQQQLKGLNGQEQLTRTVNLQIEQDNVSKGQAGLEAAIAAETAARLKYERYRRLASEGAVARELVDQLNAEWQATRSMVDQERANLNTSHTAFTALKDGVPVDQTLNLQNHRLSLAQAVTAQASLVNTLATQLATSQKQLQQAQSALSDRRDVTIKAPFAGVVYTTERDAGEQVNRPDALLTLLDCNDLWIEALVSAEQANRIDAQSPVQVQLVGEPNPVMGQVDVITAINRMELAKDQAKTLLPALPASLEGQAIAQVTVRIPPLSQGNAQKFCGIGRIAQLTFNLKRF